MPLHDRDYMKPAAPDARYIYDEVQGRYVTCEEHARLQQRRETDGAARRTVAAMTEAYRSQAVTRPRRWRGHMALLVVAAVVIVVVLVLAAVVGLGHGMR